ncbi:MAG: NAD(P)/FAD-dependent oxidoreductase [Microbacteriaceae bacterium]
MNENTWDVAIIGGGVAGLSAALVLARSRRRVLVIDAGEPRNRVTEHMHGVLGRDGTSPLALVSDGRREVEGYGGVVIDGTVVALRPGFELNLADGTTHTARRVIVATGLRDVMPDIDGLGQHWGAGVVGCPYCDGWEARDGRVAVIPSMPIGLHVAQLLRQLTDRVTVFTGLIGELGDDELRALTARGIAVESRGIRRVHGERGGPLEIELVDGERVPVDTIFAGATPAPNDSLLRSIGAEFAVMHISEWPVLDATGRTSIAGVWAIGNSASMGALVPVVMGMGVMAATTINAELVGEEVAAAIDKMV